MTYALLASLLATCMLLGAQRRTILQLRHTLALTQQNSQKELEKARDISTRLLVAHEELVDNGLTEDRVAEAVIRRPGLVTAQMRLEVLREHGYVHDWEEAGSRRVVVTEHKKNKHYTLVTELCSYCRLEHQYFRDGGHPDVADMEGFFLGGKRVPTKNNQQPRCVIADPVS